MEQILPNLKSFSNEHLLDLLQYEIGNSLICLANALDHKNEIVNEIKKELLSRMV